MKNYRLLQNKPLLLTILVLVLGLYLYGLFGRTPDIDDGWIGELAYWKMQDGQVRSELMRGITLQEEKYVVNHKLFVLNGALFSKLFGFSLYTLKSVSLVWFAVFIVLFSWYSLRWKKYFSTSQWLLVLIVMFSFHQVFKYSFVFRPEIMMMTLGLAGFIFLQRFLESGKTGGKDVFFAGLLFGLSMAVHLNGIIYASAAFVLLLLNRRFRAAWWFPLAVLPGFAVFFYDMHSLADFALWKHQFFESPSLDGLKPDAAAWLKPLYNLAGEHRRFFHDDRIFLFTLLLLTTLAAAFRPVYRKHPQLYRFALLVALFTGLFAMHKAKHYLLLNFPFLLLLFGLSVKALVEGQVSRFRIGNPAITAKLVTVLFFLFLVTVNYFNFDLARHKFSPETNRKLALRYANENESRMNIVAPVNFIFDEIHEFNRVQAVLCYTEMQKTDSSIYSTGFLEKAAGFDADLLIVPPIFQNRLGIENLKPGNVVAGFVVIDNPGDTLILRNDFIDLQADADSPEMP